jgi:hypothetical protein
VIYFPSKKGGRGVFPKAMTAIPIAREAIPIPSPDINARMHKFRVLKSRSIAADGDVCSSDDAFFSAYIANFCSESG